MKQSFKSVLMEKDAEMLRREIKWLKRHIRAREAALAVKEKSA